MPMYYFNLHDSEPALEGEPLTLIVDEEGVELSDYSAAYVTAIDGARSIMADEIRRGRLCVSNSIEVTTATGEIVLRLSFRDTFELVGF